MNYFYNRSSSNTNDIKCSELRNHKETSKYVIADSAHRGETGASLFCPELSIQPPSLLTITSATVKDKFDAPLLSNSHAVGPAIGMVVGSATILAGTPAVGPHGRSYSDFFLHPHGLVWRVKKEPT